METLTKTHSFNQELIRHWSWVGIKFKKETSGSFSSLTVMPFSPSIAQVFLSGEAVT